MTFPGIRIVLADDDISARARLRLLLSAEAGVQVVAECTGAAQIAATIEKHKPGLLFLDVHVPDADGLQVLHCIPAEHRPVVIFTSANDQYAVRAFEARALDYLVKPLDAARVHTAIERTRAEILRAQDRHVTHRLLDLLSTANAAPSADRRLVVKTGGRVVFLEMDEIDWIEAAGNYVKLQATGRSYVLRERISYIGKRLDPAHFVRIHRSIIVNIRRIKELHPCNRGEYMVILKDGKELSCSRGYRSRLQQIIATA